MIEKCINFFLFKKISYHFRYYPKFDRLRDSEPKISLIEENNYRAELAQLK